MPATMFPINNQIATQAAKIDEMRARLRIHRPDVNWDTLQSEAAAIARSSRDMTPLEVLKALVDTALVSPANTPLKR